MTRREAWLSALGIFAISLVARAAAAALVVFPIPEDTAYYVSVSEHLVQGRGLVADALWSFQTPPLVFPRPAFEVWLPLPSLVAAVPMLLFGPTFRAAQVMAVIVGAIVPVLVWRLAADVAAERQLPVGRARTLAIGSGLSAAVSLPLLLHSTLPDSTMPFAALALGACLLMTRLTGNDTAPGVRDARLVGLGALIGLAALTRNEALWIGLAWAWLALRRSGWTRGERTIAIVVPAVVAGLIFAPWAVRDWLVFGNPLPGQALANALSVSGFDIFAWSDPPTVARYLAVGPARLVEMRIEGLGHNLFSVLLLPGAPLSVIGLISLPIAVRHAALRPLVLVAAITFLVTSLVFPVATTWGTFLHAAGPVHALLVISSLLGLDALIAAVGRRRGWTKPVAWLAPTLTVAGGLLFSLVLLPSFGGQSQQIADRYTGLGQQLQAAGLTGPSAPPVVTDFPIWLAASTGTHTLALPAESPTSVADLARTFGAETLILGEDDHGGWPGVLATNVADAGCFHPVTLPPPADESLAAAVANLRVYRIACP
ncbi:MAG TPA: hypothetical protein VFP22_10685 [Candidatus Limnocylindrales bacterium]|nr:hypothetical protein [Candidatus Limnocylindrales bacterium]